MPPPMHHKIELNRRMNAPLEEMARALFGAIVGGWFEKSYASNRESCTLATRRDTLLPKLLSGQLLARDARRLGEV